MRAKTASTPGFTLLELMIVVVVLGVLAAISIPAYSRYRARSRTAEALQSIRRIYDGQSVYVERSPDISTQYRYVNQPFFTPDNTPRARRYPANVAIWTTDPEWREIGFAMTGAHFYAYNSFSSGVGVGTAYFLSRAIGNLDGDSVESTFTVRGDLTTTGTLRSSVDVVHELE